MKKISHIFKNKYFLVGLILVILLLAVSGCKRVKPMTNKPIDVQEHDDSLIEANEKVFNLIHINMDSDDDLEALELIQKDDYTFRINFSDDNNKNANNEDETYFGKLDSVSLLDITNDGYLDVFISADEGGSLGSHVYYFLTYADDTLQSMNLSEMVHSDDFNFTFNENGFYVLNWKAEEFIPFTDSTRKTLNDLNIGVPQHYELFPAVMSYEFTDDHELVLTAKRALSVEHKLNVVAEIVSTYLYHDGWIRVDLDIHVSD